MARISIRLDDILLIDRLRSPSPTRRICEKFTRMFTVLAVIPKKLTDRMYRGVHDGHTVQHTYTPPNASAWSNPSSIDNDMVSVKINECVVLEFVLNGFIYRVYDRKIARDTMRCDLMLLNITTFHICSDFVFVCHADIVYIRSFH